MPFVAGKEIRAEDEMSDLTSLIMTTPPSGALLVVGLLMALRVVRALQKSPVSSRRAIGSRRR